MWTSAEPSVLFLNASDPNSQMIATTPGDITIRWSSAFCSVTHTMRILTASGSSVRSVVNANAGNVCGFVDISSVFVRGLLIWPFFCWIGCVKSVQVDVVRSPNSDISCGASGLSCGAWSGNALGVLTSYTNLSTVFIWDPSQIGTTVHLSFVANSACTVPIVTTVKIVSTTVPAKACVNTPILLSAPEPGSWSSDDVSGAVSFVNISNTNSSFSRCQEKDIYSRISESCSF